MSIRYHDKTVASAGGASNHAKELIDALDAKKQDKLTGQPGQVVGFDAEGAAAPIDMPAQNQGGSGTQLLDNAYWAAKDAIVNQRGQDEYTQDGYMFDRWYNRECDSVLIGEDGVTFTVSTVKSYPSGFNQRIEYPSLLLGKTVTVSVLVDENTFTQRDTEGYDPVLCVSFAQSVV